MNSFKDFISVAEHLIDINLTAPDRLAAMGTSAGGLLVGKDPFDVFYFFNKIIRRHVTYAT